MKEYDRVVMRKCLLIGFGFGLFFLVFRIVLLAMTASGKMLPSVLQGIWASPRLGFDLLFFVVAVLVLHLLPGLLWVWLSSPLFSRLPDRKTAGQLLMFGFILLLFCLLLGNSAAYPESGNAFWNEPGPMMRVRDLMLAVLAGILGICAAVGLALRIGGLKRHGRHVFWIALAAMLVLGAGFCVRGWWVGSGETKSSRTQPDVILLGVDGVIQGHMGYYNGFEVSLTPALDGLFEHALAFHHAWTPLARTFPAWLTILTGQYPSTHGGIFNLINPGNVRHEDTLAHQLGAQGYHRIYAIDETRFSNIDEAYGFDRLVSPPMGASDFLIGTLADIPLVNLLASTALGRWFFPTLYMNRALSKTYRPELFDREVARAVRSTDPRKPLFLAVHFELPHWPYTWFGHDAYQPESPPELASASPEYYHKALARADEQVGDLLSVLRDSGRLDHAIVFVFSDHGETFEKYEAEWTWRGRGDATGLIALNRNGHGTSVANASQNRIPFAVLAFGQGLASRLEPNANVSLADIRPTLEEWLDLPDRGNSPREGRSLMKLIRAGHDPELENRAVPVETGFSLPSMERGNPNAREALQAGSEYYEVTRQGRMVIRESWIPFLKSQKQRAALSGNWVLAAFPDATRQGRFQVRLINSSERNYWDAHDEEVLPQEAPVSLLREALKTNFGLEY
jgi:arylsulfatase A-like enzyme